MDDDDDVSLAYNEYRAVNNEAFEEEQGENAPALPTARKVDITSLLKAAKAHRRKGKIIFTLIVHVHPSSPNLVCSNTGPYEVVSHMRPVIALDEHMEGDVTFDADWEHITMDELGHQINRPTYAVVASAL